MEIVTPLTIIALICFFLSCFLHPGLAIVITAAIIWFVIKKV